MLIDLNSVYGDTDIDESLESLQPISLFFLELSRVAKFKFGID